MNLLKVTTKKVKLGGGVGNTLTTKNGRQKIEKKILPFGESHNAVVSLRLGCICFYRAA